MSIALKYSTKTVSVTIGTDVTDQALTTVAASSIYASAVHLISQSETVLKYVVIVVHA